MREMTVKEFRESGLLWHVNEAVLWPLGMALAVAGELTPAGMVYEETMRIFVYDDAIWSGATAEESSAQGDRLKAFMKQRMGELE